MYLAPKARLNSLSHEVYYATPPLASKRLLFFGLFIYRTVVDDVAIRVRVTVFTGLDDKITVKQPSSKKQLLGPIRIFVRESELSAKGSHEGRDRFGLGRSRRVTAHPSYPD